MFLYRTTTIFTAKIIILYQLFIRLHFFYYVDILIYVYKKKKKKNIYIEDLTRVVILYEIYETSLGRVS